MVRTALDAVASLPYLAASVAFLLGVLILLRVAVEPPHREVALLGGLFNSPFALFSVLLEGSYWSPRRLGALPAGLEDLLMSFAAAAMAWALVALVHGRRIEVCLGYRRAMYRYLRLVAYTTLLYAAMLIASGDAMTALLASFPVVVAVQLWRRPQLWPLATAGAVAFPAVYYVGVGLLVWLLPGVLSQWNLGGIWGATLLGIPRGEVLWAIGFGGALPLLLGHCVEARMTLTSAPRRVAPPRGL